MKKLLGIATMALTFGTISLFAQNTDAQIKQLEKELRLLELQKQVEQAKQGGNQSTDTKQPQATNKQAQSNKSKCGNDYTFTSCYFGVELGVTLGSSATYLQSKMGATKYSGVSDAKTGGTYLAMTAQLIGGYQWYFHDKMGLGINALLGYGGSSAHSTFTYTAITWGADLQYLVDFTRIFGISAGLGFEMVHLSMQILSYLVRLMLPHLRQESASILIPKISNIDLA